MEGHSSTTHLLLFLLTLSPHLSIAASWPCDETNVLSIRIIEDYGPDNGSTESELIRDFSEIITVPFEILSVTPTTNHAIYNKYFEVTGIKRSKLKKKGWIDREAIARDLLDPFSLVEFKLDVVVFNSTFSPISCIDVMMQVLDLDDNMPTFTVSGSTTVTFNENDEVAYQQRSLPYAVDDDQGINGTSLYELTGDSEKFELVYRNYTDTPRVQSLYLKSIEPLNREENASYQLTLRASEGNSNPDSAVLNIQVLVSERCDESPVFSTTRYTPTLFEDAIRNTFIVNVSATDADDPLICPLIYEIVTVCARETKTDHCQTMHNRPFILDSESGKLTLDTELDREQFCEYELTVHATDGIQSSSTAMVIISIEDINDNDPIVNYNGLRSIPEIQAVDNDRTIGYIQVMDLDSERNGQVRVRLLDNSTGSLVLSQTFRIDQDAENSYELKLNQMVDFETQRKYLLVVEAHDNGTNPRTTYKSVTIEIQDHNDHPPEFVNLPTTVNLSESSVQNDVVATVTTTDQDTGSNAAVRYELPPANSTYPHQNLLKIESEIGLIQVQAEQLDYEQITSFIILVRAANSLSLSPLHTDSELTVTLTNVNDNTPQFVSPATALRVNETARNGYIIGTVVATDADNLGPLQYSISSNSPLFSITSGGIISLAGALDYETTQSFTITVEVTDSNNVNSSSLTIDVLPVNDERPIFETVGRYVATVYENETPDLFVVAIAARDPDNPPQPLQFAILQSGHSERFRIDSAGYIYTVVSLDRETTPNYTLYIEVSDGQLTSDLKEVFVMVGDVNDHVPEFIGTPYVFEIQENNAPNQLVGPIKVLSLDQGNNSNVHFFITGGNGNNWFKIDLLTGTIRTNNTELDREVILSPINLQVEVRDLGIVSKINSTSVQVIVTDVNDNPPVFQEDIYTFTVQEDHPIGQVFGAVRAFDADGIGHNDTIYRFSEEPQEGRSQFHIDESTGNLDLVASLDYETRNSVTFTVVATDANRGDFQTSTTVFINITNARDLNLTLPDGFSPHYSIYENIPANFNITSFEVTDAMQNSVNRLIYTLTRPDNTPSPKFGIMKEGYTAVIFTHTESIDREAAELSEDRTYILKLNVSDPDTSEDSYGYIVSFLSIKILDVNDNPPFFEPSPEEYFVQENGEQGKIVATLEAKDIDEGSNGTIQFSLDAGLPFNVTHVVQNGKQLAVIRVLTPLDREERDSYSFLITATDMGTPQSLLSTKYLTITVMDKNDNDPVICEQSCTYSIREDLKIGEVVGTVIATDADAGDFGSVRYEVAPGSIINSAFSLQFDTGRIILMEELDREMEDGYTFSVRAIDGGNRAATGTIMINVTDVNEYAPIFVNSSFTVSIPESEPNGVPFTSLVAVDQDATYNAEVQYVLADHSLSNIFCLNKNSGEVSICDSTVPPCTPAGVIDYERQNEYKVEIIAYDHGKPRRFSNRTLTVQITNINEHHPEFDVEQMNILVSENLLRDSTVLLLQAYDLDDGDQLRYEVVQQMPDNFFRWDDGSSALVLDRQLNYNTNPLFVVQIRVKDRAEHSRDIVINIYVRNENNLRPIFENEDGTTLSIRESLPVLSTLLNVRATDADNRTNDAVFYSISAGNTANAFAVNSSTGSVYINTSLDYETQSTYSLTILATDTGESPLVSEPLSVMINIFDENDEAPIFTQSEYTFHIKENSPTGATVDCVSAPDRDQGIYGVVLYSIVDEGSHNGFFSIAESTGCVTVIKEIDREDISDFQLKINAKDKESPTKSASTTVTIIIDDENDNGPTFPLETYLFYISPDYDISIPVGRVTVNDADSGSNAEFVYSVTSSNPSLTVSLLQNGDVKIDSTIPTSYQPSYSVGIRVTSATIGDTRYDDAEVMIIIETEGDHHPRFSKPVYEKRVSESADVGYSLFDVSGVVTDTDGTSDIAFSFVGSYPKFALDTESGVISLQQTLNYEEVDSYDLKVKAVDTHSSLTRTATATIRVSVDDGNNHAPIFVNPLSTIVLSRLPYSDIELFKVVAEDRDTGDHGTVGYSIVDDSSHMFQIDPETGVVTNRVALMTDGLHSFIIRAFDKGSPLKSSNITVSIEIKQPSNPPQFPNGDNTLEITLTEEEETPKQVQGLSTSPEAESFHIVYSNASKDMFSINSDNYLVLESELSYEVASHYMLIIEARNVASNGYRFSSFLLVTIVVTDVNNNSPEFRDISPQAILESRAINTVVFTVQATDIDSGSNGEVTYAISGGNVGNTFSIDRLTGQVNLTTPLDRETTASYKLEIRALDGGVPNQQHSTLTVDISVLDENDNPPTFSPGNYSISVYEFPHTATGSRIIQVMAEDRDLGPPLNYNLVLLEGTFMSEPRNPSPDTFSIDYDTGEITTHRSLDREEIDHYLLRIEVGDSEHTDTTYLTVTVLDANDHTPRFTHTNLPEVEIYELRPVNWPVLTSLRAADGDINQNGLINYRLGGGWPSGKFKIDPWTGVIRVAEEFVYNANGRTIFGEVLAVDLGAVPNTATTTVTVQIIDVNDHPPILDDSHFHLDISVTQPLEETITKFNYTDEVDSGFNTATMMRIPSYYSDAFDLFRISDKGELELRRSATDADIGSFIFRIGAIQEGSVPHCPQFNQAAYAHVIVTVHRENKYAPHFTSSLTSVNLDEDTAIGTRLNVADVDISAVDDDGDQVTYHLLSERENLPFSIRDPTLPYITITRQLNADAPDTKMYNMSVEVKDNGFPIRTTVRTLRIVINNINDLPPAFPKDSYSAWVAENSPVGTTVLTVTATDLDNSVSSNLTYHMVKECNVDCPPFEVSSTGVITTTGDIDYEQKNSYFFQVSVTDTKYTNTTSVMIDVSGENEFPPRFAVDKYEFQLHPEKVGKGSVVGRVEATDEDGGDEGVLIYTFVDEIDQTYDIFDINSTTGEIFLEDIVTPQQSNRRKRSVQTTNDVVVITRTVQAMDSAKDPQFDTVEAEITVPKSFFDSIGGTTSADTPSPPFDIIIIVVVAVSVAICIFVALIVAALVFKNRGKNKKWKIKVEDSRNNLGGGSIEMTSERYSQNGGLPPSSQPRHATTTLQTGHSASGSEGSYTGTADDEMESGNEIHPMPRFTNHSPALPTKALHSNSSPRARSTSDLASTVCTEAIHSQTETHPYSKAQLMRIYAANEQLLDDNVSHDSVRMFGSQGGGEADGDLDINNLIFQKINDLEDDEETATIMDDDASTTYSKGRGTVMVSSAGNIDILPPEEREDPMLYPDSIKPWLPPSGRTMEETIDEITATSSFASQEEPLPRRHPYEMSGYSHSQGASLYGGSTTQETFIGMRSQPKHFHMEPKMRGVHDYPHHLYYPEEHERLSREHERERQRHTPRASHRYGSASVLSANPDYRRETRQLNRSQDVAPPYTKYSPFIPGRRAMAHNPYMTPTDGTDDGTVTPQTALTGDYHYLSSSSTSLTSTNVSGNLSQPSRRGQLYN